jgi:hypothetical protein
MSSLWYLLENTNAVIHLYNIFTVVKSNTETLNQKLEMNMLFEKFS